MDFTAAYRATALCYSPGSTFLASLSGSSGSNTSGSSSSGGVSTQTVLVRAALSLAVVRVWTLPLRIASLAWSPDGAYLLAVARQDATVFVLSLDPARDAQHGQDAGEGWVARIQAGAEGLVAAQWAPNAASHTVLCFSEDQLRVSAYELATQRTTLLEAPKVAKAYGNPQQASFALLQRANGKDGISVLSHNSTQPARPAWTLSESFAVATNDAVDMAWAPSGLCLAVWESALEYKLRIYTLAGFLRATFAIGALEANVESTTSGAGGGSDASQQQRLAASGSVRRRNDDEAEALRRVAGGALGIRTVAWSPNGKMLAVGGYDEQVRVLEDVNWEEMATLDHARRSIMPGPARADAYGELIAWREPNRWIEETGGRGIVPYERGSLPAAPAALRVDHAKANPKVGVHWLAWSPDGTLLATRNENVPACLYIWAFAPAASGSGDGSAAPYLLALLSQSAAIEHAAWRPGTGAATLALVAGGAAVYLWRREESPVRQGEQVLRQRAEAVPVPIDDFGATELLWSPDGQKLTLLDGRKGAFCCAIDAPDEQSFASQESSDERLQ